MEPASPTEDILDQPVIPPSLATHVQHLDNPPNENRLALGVIGACIIVSTVFSVLRVYSRLFCAGKVRVEDCKYHQLSYEL